MNHFLRTRAIALLLILSVVALLGAVACQGKQGIEGPPGVSGSAGVQGGKGDPGPRGIQGIKGDPGPRGIQGIKGDGGAKGAQGDPAPNGTAQITLDPHSGAAPAPTFTIYGAGFQSEEAVLASVEGYSTELPSTLVGGAIASTSGAFKIAASMLRDHSLSEGVYTVKIVGSEGSLTTAAFVVTAIEK
jgi:hypothetical protein